MDLDLWGIRVDYFAWFICLCMCGLVFFLITRHVGHSGDFFLHRAVGLQLIDDCNSCMYKGSFGNQHLELASLYFKSL